MNWNVKLFFKINGFVHKNHWLDAFGRAGAEWAIVAMTGWFSASVFIERWPSRRAAMLFLAWTLLVWLVGWLIDIGIGYLAHEPRPHITYPESRLLFTPMQKWKSFPSDHAMAAWLMVFLANLARLPGAIALFPLALWVSWGRVYAGVHYPGDILGGLVMAGLAAGVSHFALASFF
ncbi:MAG: phosphatase PAP2 family protein [Candidatus Magasanikbacteria bacterium]|nr:phosphatase PAP2 family protein [Candidatus Magasanikbacteria bacterium]